MRAAGAVGLTESRGGAHEPKDQELETSIALWVETQCDLKSNIFLVASRAESKNKNK